MNQKKPKRNRGIILTRKGWQKLQNAKTEWEFQENSGCKYTLGEVSERAGLAPNTVAKVLARQEGVDKQTIVRLFTAFDLELEKSDYTHSDPNSKSLEGLKTPKRIDWGEATDVAVFYGRTDELALLEKWLIRENCRVVALLGMGGIGKTALAVKLTQQIQRRFEYIVWRSLYNAPPLFDLLGNLIQFFSNNQVGETELPKSIDGRISRLVDYLQKHFCLIILDNIETILQSDTCAGCYRKGYEDYGQLIKQLGEIPHQSSLIITSREKPKDVASLEGEGVPIRSLQLNPLKEDEGKKIFQLKGLSGGESEEKALVELYSGNPLALKMVATTIQDVFNGNISEFLSQKVTVFGDISSLLKQHFERLSDLERHIMYWLAINYEPTTLSQLQEDIISRGILQGLLEALESLIRRCLIEKASSTLVEKSGSFFTLQPVLREYVICQLVKQVCQEITTQKIVFLQSHALLKAQSKEYTRESQIRLILQPLLCELLTIFKTEKKLKEQLIQILVNLREEALLEPGYTAGNILNMLCQLKSDLRGSDFSHLTIWQSDFRGVNLAKVNFQNADLSKSVFTKSFSKISSVAFSPNGKILATSDANGQIYLWRECINNEQLLTCQGHISWVRAIAFSPDSNTLCSGGTDKNVKLWDVSTGQCLKSLMGHPKRVRSVAFSPNGKILASGSDDQTISLWNVNTGLCEKILRGHNGRVLSVVIHPQGKILASASSDKTLKLWNVVTGECLKTLQGHTGCVLSVAFSPDGKILGSGSEDQTVKCWNVSTGVCEKTLQEHHAPVQSVAFAPKGHLLASGSDDQTVKLWDVRSGLCHKTLQGHIGCVWAVAFSPDGKIVVSGSDDHSVRLWDVTTGEALKNLQGFNSGVLSVAFAPHGGVLVSSNDDQTVKLWDVTTGQCVKTLEGHPTRVRTVAFSPNGKILASGSYDHLIRLWDTDTCQCYKILKGHTGWVKSVVFDTRGQILASGSDDQTVRLWDVSTGQVLRTLEHGHGVWSVAISPNGQILASGDDDHKVRLWDVRTGEDIKTFVGHTSWVLSVAFSPQGNTLASGSKDQTIKLWDIRTGECVQTFTGHTSWILSIAFSPQGNILASGSVDQMVKLWDIQTGQCINTLEDHTHWIRSVAFSPDGKTVVSGSQDGTVKLWNILTGECLKTLRNERPYEGMNISGVTGLTDTTIVSLKALGAIE